MTHDNHDSTQTPLHTRSALSAKSKIESIKRFGIDQSNNMLIREI